MDPPVNAHGDGYMILNQIGHKEASTMYLDIKLLLSLLIDHFEASQIGK